MYDETDENATEAEKAEKAHQKVSLEVNNVIFKLKKLLDEYTSTDKVISNNDLASSVISSNRRRKYDLVDFDNEEDALLSSSSSLKTALDLYLDEPRKDRNENLNVLHFWKENEQKYGSLARLARDILTVPLTTVSSESTFSIGGKILNKWRSSYLPKNIEVLITSRSWLCGYEVDEEEEFMGSDVDWNIAT